MSQPPTEPSPQSPGRTSELHVQLPGGSQPLVFTETVRAGRAATNGIVVDDEVVSSEHLELRCSGEDWEVVDLASTNGTFLNGVHIVRETLAGDNRIRLGAAGPELRVMIPGARRRVTTRRLNAKDIAARFLGTETPGEMSAFTATMRAAVHEYRVMADRSWLQRIRNLRAIVGLLAVVALGVAAFAVVQFRRVNEMRATAGEVFNTLKSLELEVRRLQAVAGPDSTMAARRGRLQAQYDQLVQTLGIYSSGTPADVQLIYQVIHRLGESEAMVPRAFVNEVRRVIRQWQAQDLELGLTRANTDSLGLRVAAILGEHDLPREFFYLALQESKLDPRAIGPSTRFGYPKGLWQFIPSTAEAYGLHVGPLTGEPRFDPNDERHDVAKSTAAAARYLSDLFTTDAQASGLLVIAAYNMGQTRILPLIRSLPESPSERNWWRLIEEHRDRIPDETYNYVLRVVAAAVIGADPGQFGFSGTPPLVALPATADLADAR